jgi:hypothetical protein
LVGPEYGELADLLAELRPQLLSRFQSGEARLAVALRLIDSELPGILQHSGREAALLYALKLIDSESST